MLNVTTESGDQWIRQGDQQRPPENLPKPPPLIAGRWNITQVTQALSGLGQSAAARRDFPLAIHCFEQLTVINPGAEAYKQLGGILYLAGRVIMPLNAGARQLP